MKHRGDKMEIKREETKSILLPIIRITPTMKKVLDKKLQEKGLKYSHLMRGLIRTWIEDDK